MRSKRRDVGVLLRTVHRRGIRRISYLGDCRSIARSLVRSLVISRGMGFGIQRKLINILPYVGIVAEARTIRDFKSSAIKRGDPKRTLEESRGIPGNMVTVTRATRTELSRIARNSKGILLQLWERFSIRGTRKIFLKIARNSGEHRPNRKSELRTVNRTLENRNFKDATVKGTIRIEFSRIANNSKGMHD